jgi:hypothetical protein
MKINNILIIQLFIVLYIVIYLFFSKYYHGKFSESLEGKIILFVLIIFMITSIKQHKLLLVFFLIVIFISLKDNIKEHFSDFLRQEIKSKENENKELNDRNKELTKDQVKMQTEMSALDDKVRTAEAELKTKDIEQKLDNANNDVLKEEQNNAECERAERIMNDRLRYSSDVEEAASKRIAKCLLKDLPDLNKNMKSSNIDLNSDNSLLVPQSELQSKEISSFNESTIPNLDMPNFDIPNSNVPNSESDSKKYGDPYALIQRKEFSGFNKLNMPNLEGYTNKMRKLKCKNKNLYYDGIKVQNYSNLNYMIKNFEFINSTCNPCLKGCKIVNKDRIDTESRLIPINTRYFK